ncbi:hypothetical protein CIB48_g5743 [Xylaria polymorpha]|nr:hypothetical protein CIB48_g5743 [Xylaria polymorpha]
MDYYGEYDNMPFRSDHRSHQIFQHLTDRRKSALRERERTERQRVILLFIMFVGTFYWALRPLPTLTKPRDEAGAIPPGEGNAVGQTATFWRDYRELVTAVEDYDDWFADADAATDAINTMWSQVAAPSEAWHDYFQRLISSRAKRLSAAHAHWTKFLDNRESVIIELAGSAGALWRVYVDGHPLDETETGDLNKRWVSVLANSPNLIDIESLAYEKKKAEEKDRKGEESSPLDEEGFAALRFSARRIIEELVRTHAELFKDLDVTHKHIREAADADRELKDLTTRLGEGWHHKGFWSTQKAISVSKLKRRMEKLQGKREAMAIWLEWLQMQFPEDIESSPEKIVNQTAWLENAKELLHEWVAALLDVQEGVLFLLRRRELPPEERLAVNYVQRWEAWKSRNCGGTSCYNAPGVMANVKIVMHTGKPVANVAEDEADWIRSLEGDGTPRVWRGVYDKACCQTSILSDRIQHGLGQPPLRSR